MSGTSLDGIDVALLETDGEDVVERGPAATYPYRPDQQAAAAGIADAAARLSTTATTGPASSPRPSGR